MKRYVDNNFNNQKGSLNMDNKNNIVLSVHSLKKLFRNGRGVNNITLNVNEGDIVGLLGPNGSGKTTAMKSIIGMNRIDEGRNTDFW